MGDGSSSHLLHLMPLLCAFLSASLLKLVSGARIRFSLVTLSTNHITKLAQNVLSCHNVWSSQKLCKIRNDIPVFQMGKLRLKNNDLPQGSQLVSTGLSKILSPSPSYLSPLGTQAFVEHHRLALSSGNHAGFSDQALCDLGKVTLRIFVSWYSHQWKSFWPYRVWLCKKQFLEHI